MLLRNLNPDAPTSDEGLFFLEQKLNEIGIDVEEVKQTQPQFFNMIKLLYQVNM